jgi:hypothetical protein
MEAKIETDFIRTAAAAGAPSATVSISVTFSHRL